MGERGVGKIDDSANILASAEFFDICTEQERQLLAFASERKRYPAAAVILKRGEIPLGAQVLISGSVSIMAEEGGEPNPHVVSQPGAVLSTLSLVIGRPREVTISAVSIVETLLVPRSAFLKLANQSPELALRAARRIRQEMSAFVSTVTPLKGRIKAN